MRWIVDEAMFYRLRMDMSHDLSRSFNFSRCIDKDEFD
jgi:hypothetical protein